MLLLFWRKKSERDFVLREKVFSALLFSFSVDPKSSKNPKINLDVTEFMREMSDTFWRQEII